MNHAVNLVPYTNIGTSNIKDQFVTHHPFPWRNRSCDLVVKMLLQLYRRIQTKRQGHKQEKTSFTQAFLLTHSYASHRFSHSGRTKYRHQCGLPSTLVLRSTSFNPEVSGLSPQSFSKAPVVYEPQHQLHYNCLQHISFMRGWINCQQSKEFLTITLLLLCKIK